jgi:hypothetical protein
MPTEIILVAGVDYPKYEHPRGRPTVWELKHSIPDSTRWRTYCERWARRVTAATKDRDTLRITLFDFRRGTRETLIADRNDRVRIRDSDDSHSALLTANYRLIDDRDQENILLEPVTGLNKPLNWLKKPQVFYFPGVSQWFGTRVVTESEYKGAYHKDLNEHSLSVTDVYDYICGLARDRDRVHTLAELHFFAHSYSEGPILVNTVDLTSRLTGVSEARDRLDRDARAEKDFGTSNLGMECFSHFAEAFCPGAIGVIWGCDYDRFWKKLIQETNRKRGRTRSVDIPLTPFTYTDKSGWGVDEEEFHKRLGTGGNPKQSDRKSLKDVKELVTDNLEETYMQKLSTVSRVPVVGALPGTYSDFDSVGKVDERFLHIPMGARTGNGGRDTDEMPVDFSSVLEFYRSVVEVKFDLSHGYGPPFGRGYGAFHA